MAEKRYRVVIEDIAPPHNRYTVDANCKETFDDLYYGTALEKMARIVEKNVTIQRALELAPIPFQLKPEQIN
jgi:hypothetical protein